MIHLRHKYSFWRTIYPKKTMIRIYLCNGENCYNIKTAVKKINTNSETITPTELVEDVIQEKVKEMLIEKKEWLHLQNLREGWKHIGKKFTHKHDLTYCSNCGHSEAMVTSFTKRH